MKTIVVTTTIYKPTFLTTYAENAKKFGHDVSFIVIGDRKTPLDAEAYCETIKDCEYWDVDIQKRWLGYLGFDLLSSHLPENSIARRNIGHLIAYMRGADRIIMLDDDNLSIPDQDFVLHHSVNGELDTFCSSNGWFNVCEALVEENGVKFYARGFPPSKRWEKHHTYTWKSDQKVVVNAGLWVNDPDIDALTRLERRLVTTGMRHGWPKTFALATGTWSPWNCQNTAIAREALPSYFLSPHTGRHLDIWASYITTRIAEAQGHVIAFGQPLAFHDRSPHNLYNDLEQELPWIRMTDEFCWALQHIHVVKTGYLDGLDTVINGLQEKWKTDNPVKQQYLEGLRIWLDIFRRLENQTCYSSRLATAKL